MRDKDFYEVLYGPRSADETVESLLYWCYANLCMAHAAVKKGESEFTSPYYAIRSKAARDLKNGRMNIGPIADDEKLKLVLPKACCYCGGKKQLSVDHLIPLSKKGADSGENMVWACRQCNSSKNATDVLVWLQSNNEFPTILLLRRYLKLLINDCKSEALLNVRIRSRKRLPFEPSAIPIQFPPPSELQLWSVPLARAAKTK